MTEPHHIDPDPLRALDVLDRYGWRVRWVTELGTKALTVSAKRLILVDSTITRPEAEGVLLRVMDREGRSRPELRPLPTAAPCLLACRDRLIA